ncbi:hypothetical protein [Cupriavidus sp. D39]|uniref:hypothetical protein n=1 Tax=Cupriavidus sp. D39 TaxID=2997877 RepID=UPI00226D52ED|nr:hypothetical protein [Cupriavidus sp. D39]MCY0853668.1 hypothetical protein [Cupriavidus sp. D39]
MKTINWGACGLSALLGAVLAPMLAYLLYFAPRADADEDEDGRGACGATVLGAAHRAARVGARSGTIPV